MKRLSILSILLLSSCRPIHIKHDFAKLQNRAEKQLGYPIADWKDINKKRIPKAEKTGQPYIELPNQIDEACFSRQQAIGFALKNNFELIAAFEDLGIAKSDLVQAGLFTNPEVNFLAKYPVFNLLPQEKGIVNRHTKIDLDATMQLADFWQIPIKKKVAHDNLEIMIFTIIHLIVEISVQTKFAYDTCLYREARLYLTEQIYAKFLDFLDRTIYRQEFGLENDYDRYLAEIKVAEWQAKIIEQKRELRASYANLRNLMGVKISSEKFYLTDRLTYAQGSIPCIETLETHGMSSRPALQIKYLNIKKAQDELTLQNRKIINDFRFGIAYERDAIEGQEVGTGLHMQLPFFDPNYAQIARARFELKKANKVYKAEKRYMIDQIYQHYEHLNGLQGEVDIYTQSVLPAIEKTFDYAETFFNRMQFDMMGTLKSIINFYKAQEAILVRNYEMAKEYAQLEKTIGKIIS